MPNLFCNSLLIHGCPEELRRFQHNALPRDGEQTNNSWGGHGEGPLSFFSLLPPPEQLRCDAARSSPEEPLWRWQMNNWGCLWPNGDEGKATDNCVRYDFYTSYFCCHDFVLNVSKLYPQLAFWLVWRDVYSGDYDTPIEYAPMVVQNGVISHDYVEMSGKHLTSMLRELDKDSPRFFDFLISCKESEPDPSLPPHSPNEHSDAIYSVRTIPGPTTEEMRDARMIWPSVPENQTVGEFLSSHGNQVPLNIEAGAETFGLYRLEWLAHVVFLSCTKWQHDLPVNVRALVLPWLASLQRIATEPSVPINDVPRPPTQPTPPASSEWQEGSEDSEGPEGSDEMRMLF